LIIGLRRLSINFSNNLDIIGNNEIGQYDSTSLRFLPGFGIMIISGIFPCIWYMFLSNTGIE
jgi:uncharacterized membrane protein YfhO